MDGIPKSLELLLFYIFHGTKSEQHDKASSFWGTRASKNLMYNLCPEENKFDVIDSDRQAMIEGIKTTGELINIALSSAQTSSTVPDSCAFHSEISKQNLVIHNSKNRVNSKQVTTG